MKTLYLLRHAKSAWDDPALADHDRPLAPRGSRAAATMAKYLGERKGGPPRLDLLVCSTALRARQTLERVLAAWSPAPAVTLEGGIYLCGVAVLLQHLRALDDSIGTVMLVGHNPDFQDLATTLCTTGEGDLLARVQAKLPTGSFLRIDLPDGPWGGLERATGHLAEFVTPRDLE